MARHPETARTVRRGGGEAGTSDGVQPSLEPSDRLVGGGPLHPRLWPLPYLPVRLRAAQEIVFLRAPPPTFIIVPATRTTRAPAAETARAPFAKQRAHEQLLPAERS